MFDFPASPSNGQVYTTPTGVSYYWDATDKVWRLSGATMGAGSNLDADKLDGQDGSYYLDLANSTGTISDAQHGQRAGGNLHPLGTPTVAGFLFDAPADGLGYMRKGGVWVPSSGGAATDDLRLLGLCRMANCGSSRPLARFTSGTTTAIPSSGCRSQPRRRCRTRGLRRRPRSDGTALSMVTCGSRRKLARRRCQ